MNSYSFTITDVDGLELDDINSRAIEIAKEELELPYVFIDLEGVETVGSSTVYSFKASKRATV